LSPFLFFFRFLPFYFFSFSLSQAVGFNEKIHNLRDVHQARRLFGIAKEEATSLELTEEGIQLAWGLQGYDSM
jgi:hypothetical protein